ncbi:TetR/AcrR family transcriptional regulator [Mycobacterium xenopi]|uniref:TetR/AcrR family transcriptional regulator n=1 Tax=Mycobacterium xenopi TaxID=1789 RepID=UPI0022EB8F00|nr:TetR/AcrR family transcriptional regulator [Mycobacterium xenopi]MDA3642118.1 helix-turn-helix domain containing protein [Mycobacterium xenopi]MDA3658031.1 helix-turn-helix domain containing protein [Mycobacterium xenopi]MDA3664601.1 helix-turn-helix domain containing protein [Mycobacterium xenopi]
MTGVAVVNGDERTVRFRLIRAADAEIADRGINDVRMEAIARRAGVSRATAFRQLGTLSEVLVQVALLRSQRHIKAVHELMKCKTGAFAKVEAALIYTARELPTDPSITALIAQHSASIHNPRVHAAAVGVMGPVLQEGQRNGEIRTDVGLDELVDFLVEQTYLAAEEINRSEEAVRKRFRNFVAPALEARDVSRGEFLSRTREVEEAISSATEALQNLANFLRRDN